jgi:hypothetical protein
MQDEGESVEESVMGAKRMALLHPSSFRLHPSEVTPTGFEPSSTNGCNERGYGNPTGAGVADLYATQPDSNIIAPDPAMVARAWAGLPGAESGAVAARIPPGAPDLAEVIARWPALPLEVRAEVVTLVRGAHSGPLPGRLRSFWPTAGGRGVTPGLRANAAAREWQSPGC